MAFTAKHVADEFEVSEAAAELAIDAFLRHGLIRPSEKMPGHYIGTEKLEKCIREPN